MKKTPNYPLYETTVFRDFRVMTENVANRYPDRIAFTYKKSPHDAERVNVTYTEARERIRNLGTALIALGCTDAHVAIIGESSYDWVCFYFALMSIGAVTVPLDKDLPGEELTHILRTAECSAVVFSHAVAEKIAAIRPALPDVKSWIAMGLGEASEGEQVIQA